MDESVLELAGYSILDPLLSFFTRHPTNSSGMSTYFNQIMIRDLTYLPGEVADDPFNPPQKDVQMLERGLQVSKLEEQCERLALDECESK